MCRIARERIPSSMTDNERLTAGLRERLLRSWRELLGPASSCALALYPDHWNTGDAAIWWGTRRLLDELGIEVAYACDPWNYDPRTLARRLPEGPILLLGGGNFGDVYPREQGLRDRILGDFAGRRIIQLPQSIAFRSEGAVVATAGLLARQRDFTLMVRDAASLRFARERFPGVATGLCPDAALALELPRPSRPAEVPVLALWRTDSESGGPLPPLPAGWFARDWTVPGGVLPADEMAQLSPAGRRFKEWVGNPPPMGQRSPPRRRFAWRHVPWLWDHLAEDRTHRGLRILSRGRVVITNRLHAHLLCLLAGIPHVVCDAANGKIFAFRDTWYPTGDTGSPSGTTVRFASSAAEAVELAKSLSDALPPPA
jgi:pyruvyl transferase EpsO